MAESYGNTDFMKAICGSGNVGCVDQTNEIS